MRRNRTKRNPNATIVPRIAARLMIALLRIIRRITRLLNRDPTILCKIMTAAITAITNKRKTRRIRGALVIVLRDNNRTFFRSVRILYPNISRIDILAVSLRR